MTVAEARVRDPRDRDGAVALAAACAPSLRAQAAEIDARRRLPTSVAATLVRSGVVRLSNPLEHGGVGDFDLSLAALGRLAEASPSAAWCAAVWAQHNYQLGRWPAEAQAEYFADGRDVLCSSAFVAARSTIESVDGGYRLEGTWRFSSGCDHATWMMLGGPADGLGPALFLVAPGDWTALDTWRSSGLRGTGSNDVAVGSAFVPAHRVLTVADFTAGDPGAPGDRRSYRVTPWPLVSMALGQVVIGAARGAAAWFASAIGAADDAARRALAESDVEISAAGSMSWRDIDAVLERAASGRPLTIEDRIRLARNRTFSVQMAVGAVDRLYAAAPPEAVHEDGPLERFHRDVHAGAHQPALAWDTHAVQYGRARLGFEVQARMV